MKRKGGHRTFDKMCGLTVRIWSGEYHAWWRPAGEGYTLHPSEAGRWLFEEAHSWTKHCGPEKRIVYVEAQP